MNNAKYDLVLVAFEKLYGPYEPTGCLANFDDLASRLSKMAGRSRPWTGKYLHSLLRGYAGFTMPESMGVALRRLIAGNNQPLVSVRLYSHPMSEIEDGSVVMGKSKNCARCGQRFVPNVPWRKYCC